MSTRRAWGFAVASTVAGATMWFAPVAAHAAEYFVATTGSDANPGTLAQPFATLQKGATVAVAGDTVYVRGGIYMVATSSAITRNMRRPSLVLRLRMGRKCSSPEPA